MQNLAIGSCTSPQEIWMDKDRWRLSRIRLAGGLYYERRKRKKERRRRRRGRRMRRNNLS